MDFLKKKNFSLSFIAFLQALGLVVYCSLVGYFMWQGETIFGPPYYFLGPAMFLVLFVASALISSLLILSYPFILFWEKKQLIKALKLVIYTIVWLVLFIVLFILALTVF